jgi:putative DNA primase/helicase
VSDAYLPTPKPKGLCFNKLLKWYFEITSTNRRLRNFDRNDFITHQPFEYEPEATASLFQKYLDEVLPDKDKQKYLLSLWLHIH